MLKEIIKNKEIEIQGLKKVDAKPTTKRLSRYLKGKNNIIAELKYASPSKGKISDIPLKEKIIEYNQYASAISILTDKKYFSGNLRFINEAKKYTSLPILRKDFIIKEEQIYESRYYGADAILLIASVLSKEDLKRFILAADSLGMDCLVEARDEKDIEKVLDTPAKIIGINNRNLDTMQIDLETTSRLKKMIPDDRIVVSESGINSRKEIVDQDTNAVLIGTSLMQGMHIREMHSFKVKICGITNLEDALNAVNAGADFLGFNFSKKSKRYICPKEAKQIISQLPNKVKTVGVFVESTKKEIEEIYKLTGIDMLQLHSPDYKIDALSDYPVIKVIHVKGKERIADETGNLSFATLFDSYDPEQMGGTGKTFDHSNISAINSKVFVAGGISPGNVKEIISQTLPYCIDVCSGVENSPGKKDNDLMIKLIEEVQKCS